MSDYKCYVTIDNTRNPNELVLVSSQPKDGIFVLPPQNVPGGGTLQLELDATDWFEGPSATLVWTTGSAPDQATITMTFDDPVVDDNEATLTVTGSAAAQMAYGVSYFYASAGDSAGGAPMQRDAVPARGDPVRVNYCIVQNALAGQPGQWSLQGIKRVVWYMLENRGLDHLLGQIYTEKSLPPRVWPAGSSPQFNGLGANPTFSNTYKGQKVTANPVPAGVSNVPNPDPGEQWEHVNVQLFQSNPPASPCNMGGFLQDYHGQDSSNFAQIMQFYQPNELPVISTLAQKNAVSDAWFCSVPTQTYSNRAFSISGTADGLVDNVDLADPPFYANTIFNILTNCGFNDWAIYADDSWPPVLDSSVCFTTYQFQALYDLVGDNQNPQRVFKWKDLLAGAANGTLPAFCYVEPAWYEEEFGIGRNGNDYHPPGNLIPGENALQSLYNALVSNQQAWADTLLIVTFDEHGGTFDHVCPPGPPLGPPPMIVPPDQMSASPQHFDFRRLGVRVPTILISPHIQGGTVFRSPTDVPFDHTSLLKTVLAWQGIDVSNGTAGARAIAAPDFSGLVSSTVVAKPAIHAQTEKIALARPRPAENKQRPLSDLERSMAGFWAYKITRGKRGNLEHRKLAAQIASAKTVAEMEQIVRVAVATKLGAGMEV
jgi:phospholipase C